MKKSLLLLLVLCFCAVAALTACTRNKGNESSTAHVSKTPTVSKAEESKHESTVPNVSAIPDVSINDMSIIPDTSDMFRDESTLGEYSNGMLQESSGTK